MELKKYIIGIRTIKLKTKIAIKDLGYVGLSNGILLSQHNEVVSLDIIPEKIEMINAKKSPIDKWGHYIMPLALVLPKTLLGLRTLGLHCHLLSVRL